MARLGCCLVLISLCISIVLEPALASKEVKSSSIKATPTKNEATTKYIAPAAAPFASVVPTEQSLVKKLCKDTRKPRLCAKIVNGDKGTLLAMNPVTKAKVSIDLATSISSRVGGYMSNQLQRNHVRLIAKGPVEGCKLNYEDAVVQLNLAYINFENNPKKATLSLKKVNRKIGFCAKALELAGSQADTLPIEETNKVIKGLVEVALPVVEKQTN